MEKLGNMQQLFRTNAKFSGKMALDFYLKVAGICQQVGDFASCKYNSYHATGVQVMSHWWERNGSQGGRNMFLP